MMVYWFLAFQPVLSLFDDADLFAPFSNWLFLRAAWASRLRFLLGCYLLWLKGCSYQNGDDLSGGGCRFYPRLFPPN
jgi:hypothetical protein